jgi:hypothetical protein
MGLPGRIAEKVPATIEEISRKMAAGYSQVFPASDDTVAEYPAESRATEEAQ